MKKFACFFEIMLKFVMLKCCNHSTTTRNYVVFYFTKP